MEFTILNSDFLKVLRKCSHALERNTTIPILSNFLIDVRDGWLICTATDLNVTIRSGVRCAIKKDGLICLPGQKLLAIVSALKPTDSLTLKVDAKQAAVITCQKSRFRLAGLDAGSFPALTEEPEGATEFDSKVFLRAIERTLFMVRNVQESRFQCRAILIDSKDGQCAIVGTDVHRMGCTVWKQEAPPVKELISTEATIAISETFENEGTVAFAGDENHLWFTQGETLVVARKTVGQFPDWRRIMSTTFPHSLTLKSDSLKECFERSMICAATAKDLPSALKLEFGPADLSLFGSDAANGSESEEVIEIKYDGPSFAAGFAGPYLAEGVRACGSTDVKMSFQDAKSPFQFQPVPEDGYKYVVMPRRL